MAASQLIQSAAIDVTTVFQSKIGNRQSSILGHYQDGRGGTMLNFNRGGNFGGDLKAYIRRD